MNTTISPRISQALALIILLVMTWATLRVTTLYFSGRSDIRLESDELEDVYVQMSQRRVDIEKLEEQLSSLLASPVVRRSTIVANSERDALNQLMQGIRQSLEKNRAQLLALTESSSAQSSSTVRVQMRARMEEVQLPLWLSSIDGGEIRPRVEEITVTTQNENGDSAKQLDVSAILRMPWVNRKERAP